MRRVKASAGGVHLRTRSEKIILAVMFVVFSLYAISLLYPYVWAFYNSFKTGREYNSDHFALPKTLYLDNFVKAFSVKVGGTNILGALFNSIWITAMSVSLGLIFNAMTSYVVCKYKFWFTGFMYALVIFIQIIPIVGSLPAEYELMHVKLNIANKPWLFWVTYCGGFGGNFLYLYSAWKNLSWSYAEAAFIDGASNFTAFRKVMLPMIKPVMTSLAVVGAISAWNNYMTPYLYLNDYPTLALAVYNLQNDATRMGMPLYFSIILITIVPTVAIFIVFQDIIMKNVTTGGLKG